MKIFAGHQLNNKKTINDPIKIDNSGLYKNKDLENINNAQPANNPSNPSIKLKITWSASQIITGLVLLDPMVSSSG